MPGPWDDYATPAATAGPWEDYGGAGAPKQQQDTPNNYQGTGRPAGLFRGGGGLGVENVVPNLQSFGEGAVDAIKALPSAVGHTLATVGQGVTGLPIPGSAFSDPEETAAKVKKAYELATQGKFSEAAKHIPIIGGMYDYATSHPPSQTAGLGITNILLGKAGEAVVGKFSPASEVPTFGETPGVKPLLEVLKPSNAKQAIQDYPVVMSRLLREHPELRDVETAAKKAGVSPLKYISDRLDESMMENRHYNEAFTGPVKDSGMKVSLAPISQAIEDSISPLMRKNAPGTVKQLEALAKKYRGADSIGDLESMLRETNAKVSDLNKLNPGDRYNVTAASDGQAVLDATNKAFRLVYNDAMKNFTGSPAVRNLNFEYGKMMGYRQDLEGLVQQELIKAAPTKPGMVAKGLKAGSALIHPMKSAAGAVVDAMQAPAVDNIGKLSSAFKTYKGPPAMDYPVPPQYAGPGGGAGSPGNIPPGTYPGGRPIPAGTYPGANPGPVAGYTQGQALPSRGRLLPAPGKPPLITPPPADTSGPIPNAGPRPGAGMGQNTGTRTLTGATPGQKAPYVTPAPADTSGPTGQVPRPGSGMGQNTGSRTLPAPAQPQRNHPGDTYGPHGMGPAVTSERPPEWHGRQPQVADTHDMVKIQTKEHPEGIWVRRSDLKGPAAPLPKKP